MGGGGGVGGFPGAAEAMKRRNMSLLHGSCVHVLNNACFTFHFKFAHLCSNFCFEHGMQLLTIN